MTRITRVLALPELAPAPLEDLPALRARAADRAPGEPGESLGLVLDDPPRVAWGDWPESAALGDVRAAAAQLEGQALDRFRLLAEALDSALAAPPPGAHPASRRGVLFSPGRIARVLGANGSQGEPSGAAARCGASIALLNAVAAAQRRTPAEVLLAEWGAAPPAEPPAAWAARRGRWRAAASRALAARLPVVPLAPAADAVSAVRWLVERSKQLGLRDYRPVLHVVVPGSGVEPAAAEAGRVLGVLYALEQAAGEHPLRAAGAARAASRDEQIALMVRVREYVRARGMRAELVADRWLDSPADVAAFVEAGAADALHLRFAAFGGLHHLAGAVFAARSAGLAVSLDDWAATPLWQGAAVHVAAATGAALLLTTPRADGRQVAVAARTELARMFEIVSSRGSR